MRGWLRVSPQFWTKTRRQGEGEARRRSRVWRHGIARLAIVFLICTVHAIAWAQGIPKISDEPNTDKPLLALDTGGHTNAVYKVLVSGYKDQLISVGLDKTIRFWDLGTGEPLRVLRPPVGPSTHGWLFSAALSPDGTMLAVGTYRALTPLYDHRIHLIELPSGQLVRSLKGHIYTIYDLAFSPDGERLASASHDNTTRIWDVKTGETRQILQGHTAPVHGVAWSPDGKRLVTGSIDKTARIWVTDTGAEVAVMREATDQIPTVGWSPDGLTIATGSYDKTIRLYEPSGKYRYAWSNLANMVMSLQFSPDSKRLLYTYGSDTVPPIGAAILDMVKGPQLVLYKGHENSPICCTFTSDGKQAITGDSISRIRVWDSKTGATVMKLDGKGQTMFAAGWSVDGQAIAWGTRTGNDTNDIGNPLDRTFCLRNLDFGPPPDKTFVRAKAKLGSQRMGYNVSETPINMRKMVFLENEARLNTFTLPQPYDHVRCYGLLPGNRAVIGTEFCAYLVDVRTGLMLREMSDRGEELWGLAPSPDWRYLLTAGNDQVMRVWNLSTGAMLVALFVAGDEWIAWTPQGYYAASVAGESLMGWHLNRGPETLSDFYPASRFHKSLYRPDVIRRVLAAGDLTKAIEQADRERSEATRVVRVADVLPADVKITEPTAPRVELTDSKLTIRAAAEPTGGASPTGMQLMINGRPVGASHPIGPAPAGENPPKIEQEWNVDLPPGTYSVAVKAETNHSYALSDPVEVTRPAREGDPLPKLFVLSIDPSPDGNTAAAVPKALTAAAPGVFGEVVTRVLQGEQASPAAVDAELEKIRSQATLADTTLIYYSGRETLDTAGHYRLSAARGGSNDPAGVWFSDKDLKRELAALPGHVLMAVDTVRTEQKTDREAASGFCGSTAESGANRLDTSAGDFLRDLLSDSYGIVVMRASRRSAGGRTQGGSSHFAQAFAEAVGGRADKDQNGVIHLHELSRYLQQRVQELSGGKQVPLVERPAGVESFPLAKPKK
jgi:WD40 repeat protein